MRRAVVHLHVDSQRCATLRPSCVQRGRETDAASLCGWSGNFERHVRNNHTFERPYKCGKCNYSSADSSAVTRHNRQHTGETPAVCKFPGCSYKGPDFSNLGRHTRVHTTRERPFDDPDCGYTSA